MPIDYASAKSLLSKGIRNQYKNYMEAKFIIKLLDAPFGISYGIILDGLVILRYTN